MNPEITFESMKKPWVVPGFMKKQGKCMKIENSTQKKNKIQSLSRGDENFRLLLIEFIKNLNILQDSVLLYMKIKGWKIQ